ncbi:12758_t:CDS:2, partial [Cetraspora pellucida]
MTKKLYNDIMIIGCNKNLENESVRIDFECDIILDNIKETEDSSYEILRKIANLIGAVGVVKFDSDPGSIGEDL